MKINSIKSLVYFISNIMGKRGRKKNRRNNYQRGRSPSPDWNISDSDEKVLSSEEPADVILEIAEKVAGDSRVFSIDEIEKHIEEVQKRCPSFCTRKKNQVNSALHCQLQTLQNKHRIKLVKKKSGLYEITDPTEEIRKFIPKTVIRGGFYEVPREAGSMVVGKEDLQLTINDEVYEWAKEKNIILKD